MHKALHNNSSPRSLNPSAIFFTSFQFKSLRYFFSRVSNLTSKQGATIIARKGGPKKLSIFDREGKKGEDGRCTTILLHDL